MKKRFCSILILIVYMGVLNVAFAQNSSFTANRNTALRCLRLAENCLTGGDWPNALSQAELGLSYDDSVSDLIYVKAAASINLGKARYEVLDIIREAFVKDNWQGYSQNGARILYADLLCDTKDYESSMRLLDEEPFILSADAEFIRVKNLYRMGTQKSVADARLKVNTARRIYPNDSRFPSVFFMFEYAFMSEAGRKGLYFEADDVASGIARAYIAKLPDYADLDNEIEILASFFADEKESLRLFKAIEAKNSRSHPLMAVAGIKNGTYSDSAAYSLFFESVGDTIQEGVLQDFTLALTDDNVKYQLAEFLTNFSGTITVDEDLDLQNEMEISYENGRPSSIRYDKNTDGQIELYAVCDYGAPELVYYPAEKIRLSYSSYPEVSKINFENEGRTFNFLHEDYSFDPIELVADSVFTSVGVDFYIPRILQETPLPVASNVVEMANEVELPNSEREGGVVTYAAEKGKLYFANFYAEEKRYAYADFSVGIPFTRYVDTDGDGYFETVEEYDLIPSDSKGFDRASVAVEMETIFGKAALTAGLYLKEIKIDRNANTFYEFSETYYEYDGKMSCWDNDDNGVWDYIYIKSPRAEGASLQETSIFCDNNQNPAVTILSVDSVPVKLTWYNSEEVIYAGTTDGFYWIAQEGTAEMENVALQAARKASVQGTVTVAEASDVRFSIINIAGKIFARIIPESYVSDEQSASDEESK